MSNLEALQQVLAAVKGREELKEAVEQLEELEAELVEDDEGDDE